MGGHRARIAVSVAFVTLVTGLASGCSGAQGASGPDVGPPTASTSSTVSDPPSASGSPSASATLDAAARARIPKAARAHTAKGAEAFARFYLEQFNASWVHARPDFIAPYSLSECQTCANFIKTAAWLRDQELRYDGPPTDIGPAGWLPESGKDTVFVQIVNNQVERSILRSDGSVEERLMAIPALNEVELRWEQGAWHVAAIRIAK
jgi:hypothetical protein